LHYSGNIFWNALPSNLKTVNNVDIIKKKYYYNKNIIKYIF